MIGPAPDLLDRRLLFFTGKGGVGKSTVAAATALLASNIGKRVLLIEVDAKGDIPAQFEQRPVGFEPREVHPGVLAMAMDTEASLQEYLKLNLRVPVLGRVGPLAKALDFVAITVEWRRGAVPGPAAALMAATAVGAVSLGALSVAGESQRPG